MASRWCGSTTLHVSLQWNCAFARLAAVLAAALNIMGELFGTTLPVSLQCNCTFLRSAAVLEVMLNAGGELVQPMVLRDIDMARTSWVSPS